MCTVILFYTTISFIYITIKKFAHLFETLHKNKKKIGERLKSKTEQAQINELLCKVLCHNLTCVVHAIYEFDIDVDYIME